MSGAKGKLSGATPILRVNNLSASVAYYTEKLGFKIDWRYEDFYASVSRDKCVLFLCEGGQGHAGTWIWTGVDDVELLFAEWTASGAEIRQGPTNYPWGSREMQVVDPDGHVLRFASDATDEAFGEFPEDRTDF